MTPDVSVVIVNWNTGPLLERAVGRVRERADVPIELVVVDNASVDGSADFLRDAPDATLIVNAANAGFARASNQGIRASRGRYVLVLNPDTEVERGTVAALVRFMDEHPDAGAAAPALINPDGSLQPSGGPFPSLAALLAMHPALAPILHAPPSAMLKRDFGRDADVDEVSGACMMLRREALDDAGAFDERFFLYFEDVDLCLRLKRRGWRVCYVPGARVVHHWRSRTDPSPDAQVHHLRSKLRYVRKHFGLSGALLLRAVGTGVYAGLFGMALVRHVLAGAPEAGGDVRRSASLLRACLAR
ncbi:MAG: glycosyltransferase family 2 protein [Candidatus Rokubacteria bacterium]|nr:glycosyltransferase family 2 protein [Candidatus Rokubacteria bacterium]